MNSGVYRIRNTVNGKVYIGSTKNFAARLHSHKYHLMHRTHHSKKLQNAWNKYGTTAFAFEKVLVCSPEDLLMYEQLLIDGFSAQTCGYNQLPKAGSREGVPHDQDTLQRMKLFQRSNRKKYSWKEQSLCISEIAEMEGLPRDVLWRRVVQDGMTLQDAVTMPYKKHGQPISGMGTSMTFYEWVDRIGCTENFLRLWLGNGLTIDECIMKHKAITPCEFGRISGVNGNTFLARLRKDWSVGDALAVKVRTPLTIDDAREIRLLAKYKKNIEIAEQYGVHRDTISLIVRNISFKE